MLTPVRAAGGGCSLVMAGLGSCPAVFCPAVSSPRQVPLLTVQVRRLGYVISLPQGPEKANPAAWQGVMPLGAPGCPEDGHRARRVFVTEPEVQNRGSHYSSFSYERSLGL